eukprot:scaffold117158_cov32-Tisochrysis_lutea.AAC.7
MHIGGASGCMLVPQRKKRESWECSPRENVSGHVNGGRETSSGDTGVDGRGASSCRFAKWGVRQSSIRMPPVSPELGLSAQKNEEIRSSISRVRSVLAHSASFPSYRPPHSPRTRVTFAARAGASQ